MKKILAIVLAISLLSFGSVLAQGPPEHAGPSQEAVDEEEEKRVGPPEHAGESGPPEHADMPGPPEHSNAPEAVREMVQARISGEKESGPPVFAGIPRFLRDSLLEDEEDETVTDEVYAVEFAEANELEDVTIAVFEDEDEQVGDEFTTNEDGIAEKELENGEYSFAAVLEDYEDYVGEFEVDGEDKIVEFEMEGLEPAYFEISSLTINYNDDVEITAEIENTGEIEGEQDITAVLDLEDEEVTKSETISLDAEEADEVEFSFEVDEDAEVIVESEDDSTSREVNVD